MRPETRARVLESADRLGYRPDSIAQALVTGTSNTIGVMIPSLVDPYWAQIADAIEQRASVHGCSVLLASSQGQPQRERQMLEMLHGKRVDGVIVGGVTGDPRDWPQRASHTPLVLLAWDSTPRWDLFEELSEGPLTRRLRGLPEEVIPGEWLAHLSVDDAAGGTLIAQHLLELGHTKLAFLTCPPVRSFLLRLLGMRIALEQAGLELEAVISTADSFEDGRRAAAQLLAGPLAPTALVCGTDQIAVGAVRAAHELGVRVPADISIVGYDDIELSAYLDPPLSTLRNPMRQIGELALDLLLQGRAGECGPISRRLAGVLVPRGSSGPATTR